MEGKTRVLSVVEMRNATGEVHRFSSRSKKLVSTKIFDGESQMVQNLLFEALSTKVKTWLRKQGVNGFDRVRRALRVVQKGE